jgi:hypothetical protein
MIAPDRCGGKSLSAPTERLRDLSASPAFASEIMRCGILDQ